MPRPPERETYRPCFASIEVTLACNLRCLHCGSTSGRPRPDELSLAELRSIIGELAQLGGQEVCLLGGEPLLRKDWRHLCAAVADAGLGLVLITNGMRVNSRLALTLAKMPGLRRVGVSLDAFVPEVHDRLRGRPGSHARAMRALWLLRDAGIEVAAVSTVSRSNLGQLPAMREALRGQNVTWQIQTVSPGGHRFDAEEILSPEQFYSVGQFIAETRKNLSVQELPICGSHDLGYHSSVFGYVGEGTGWHGCGAGLGIVGITSNGQVKGCLSQHDDLIQDSVRRRTLTQIWTDPQLFARNRHFHPELLTGNCRGCTHGATCRAGCANKAYTSTGTDYCNPCCFSAIENGLVSGKKKTHV